MTHNLRVRCLINRSWNPARMDWEGVTAYGTMIDISTQSSEDGSGNIIPVGIILLENETFQSVPLEFIYEK